MGEEEHPCIRQSKVILATLRSSYSETIRSLPSSGLAWSSLEEGTMIGEHQIHGYFSPTPHCCVPSAYHTHHYSLVVRKIENRRQIDGYR